MEGRRQDARGKVEELAEALVLCDASDTGSVMALAVLFAELAGFAADNGEPAVAHLSEEAVLILESLAAEGDADAQARAFTRLSEIVTDLQNGAEGFAEPVRDHLLGETGRRTALATPAVAHEAAVLDPASNPLAEDAELMSDFVARAIEHLDAAEAHLVALECDPADSASLNSLFRCFHTIKGMAGFLSLERVSSTAHTAEDMLDEVRSTAATLDASAIEELFGRIDLLRELIDPASVSKRAEGAAVCTPAEGAGATAPAAGDDAPTALAADATVAAREAGVRETVRLDAERLDLLLDALGELVIAESMVSSSIDPATADETLITRVERLDRITRDIQGMVTALRMVSLRATFLKMSRVVRDSARKAGKPVDLVTAGEETELDKAVVDAIADPLMHIVRNAIDHGIEDPAGRSAAGKPAVGTVELRAFHKGGSVYIEVEDDGSGLDVERIRETAVARGLLHEGEELTEAETLRLIFEPGFSTAREITDVSGRGVGMDVVMRSIEALRGQVDVSSIPGKGTLVSLRLPLTLAIIDGIVLRAGSERYIVPTLSVIRSTRPTPEEIVSVVNRGELLRTQEGVLRVIRLSEVFSVSDAEVDPSRAIIVIIEDEGRLLGLLVDELLDRQNVVIKSLTGPVAGSRGLMGAAILPDGRAGLILDVSGLVRLADSDAGSRRRRP